jgi:hypothetical protein
MESNCKKGNGNKKLHVRLVLNPQNPMDKAIIEELRKQRPKKNPWFIKFATFCYIKGVDRRVPSPTESNVEERAPSIKQDVNSDISKTIQEVENINF